MQPPLDRGDRERKELGDAGDGPFLVVAQQQDRAMLGGEPRQRLGDQRALFAPRALLGGTGHGQLPALGEQQAVDLRGLGRLGAALAGGHAPGAVPGDGMEPGRELRGLLKLGKGFEGEQKRLLGHVLGPLAAAQRLRGDQRHRAAEAAHQLVEGVEVAEQGGDDERLIIDLWELGGLLHLSDSLLYDQETSEGAADRGFSDTCTGASRRGLREGRRSRFVPGRGDRRGRAGSLFRRWHHRGRRGGGGGRARPRRRG